MPTPIPDPLIDVGNAEHPSWHQLRFFLASSAVEIKREEEVRAYLETHPELFGLTEDISRATRCAFGPGASLVLDAYQDPEIEDRYLVLYVRLEKYGADVLPRIRSISDAFDDRLCDGSGSILVTTDFRPIR